MANSTPSQKIYNARGQVCGQVLNGVFCWTGTEKHVLRHPPALALETGVIRQLEALQVHTLQFTRRDTGEVFRTAFAHFTERAFQLNRGFGEQLALPLAGWTRKSKAPGGLSQLALPGGWFNG